MKEIRLALIGKNISHSQSPELYKKYYPSLQYDLIDIQQESELPSLEELTKTYMGVNITAPYKESYFGKTTPVNTIDLTDKPKGILTDRLAFKEIWYERYHHDCLGHLNHSNQSNQVILLGDGIMGNMVANVLSKFGVDYSWHSRKKQNLDDLSLNAQLVRQMIVINTCSRNYTFDQQLPKSTIFWDFNYDFENHHYLNRTCHYIDGLELLERQAAHAVDFWNFSLL